MGIKLTIFDFGDVIGHFDINHFNKFIQLNGGDSNKVGTYFKMYKSDFDKNLISETDFWTKFSDFVNVHLDWKIIADNNKKNLMVNHKLLKLILEINSEKIILSNMDITTVSQIKSEIKLQDYFKEWYFSYNLKKNKLDFSILNMICKKYGVNPNEVLFIDDYPENITQAKQFGFHGYQYENIEKLKQELEMNKLI